MTTVKFHGADFVGEVDFDDVLGFVTEIRLAAEFGDQLVGVPKQETRPVRFADWRRDLEARGGQIDE